MVHRREKLTAKEKVAEWHFLDTLSIKKRTTYKPIIVAVIGLVGSGKNEVAHELAKQIGATVIEGDAIRVALRDQKAPYEKARLIAEDVAFKIIDEGGNVILDSDFIDSAKRASLREKARKAGVKVVFVCTYCDFDIMSQRIRENDPGPFFSGASSRSMAPDKGKDVKMREMIRRLPRHYRWVDEVGGKWEIKNPPCRVIADIDTGADNRREEVRKCAKKILAL